jgi:hypothetical protein
MENPMTALSNDDTIATLRKYPAGLTSAEFITITKATSYIARGRLSKLFAYGRIDKIVIDPKNGRARWKAKPLKPEPPQSEAMPCFIQLSHAGTTNG